MQNRVRVQILRLVAGGRQQPTLQIPPRATQPSDRQRGHAVELVTRQQNLADLGPGIKPQRSAKAFALAGISGCWAVTRSSSTRPNLLANNRCGLN